MKHMLLSNISPKSKDFDKDFHFACYNTRLLEIGLWFQEQNALVEISLMAYGDMTVSCYK